MATLYAADEEELRDLANWFDEHIDAELADIPRDEIAEWFTTILANRSGAAQFPCRIDVPPVYVLAVKAVMEDWAEVLAANDEILVSYLTE